jgi:hypothetical protein
MLVDVLDQLVFGVARPGDEKRATIRNRSDDGLKEVPIFHGVPAAQRVCLMMDMPRRVIRVQYQPFDIRRAEVEYAGFMVINPNDSVIVAAWHRIHSFGPASLDGSS